MLLTNHQDYYKERKRKKSGFVFLVWWAVWLVRSLRGVPLGLSPKLDEKEFRLHATSLDLLHRTRVPAELWAAQALMLANPRTCTDHARKRRTHENYQLTGELFSSDFL